MHLRHTSDPGWMQPYSTYAGLATVVGFKPIQRYERTDDANSCRPLCALHSAYNFGRQRLEVNGLPQVRMNVDAQREAGERTRTGL